MYMTTTTNKHFLNLFILVTFTLFMTGCAQFGMISQNDVYLQKPSALSTGEDETDLTSYNAYKAKERGAYQDQYLIDQMYNRRLIGASLYGVRPMFGAPYPPGAFILYGSRPSILFYQNSFYSNSYFAWNRPWNNGFGYNCGYNPHFPYSNGMYGCLNSPYNQFGFGNPYYNYGGGQSFGNSGGIADNSNTFTGRPRMSLSSNSARSSSYPNTLKSSYTGGVESVNVNDQTQGTSRRSIQNKQAVRSSHMPFKSDQWKTQNNSSYQSKNGGSSISANRSRISSTTNRGNRYSPSTSARRSGVARSPRTSVNSSTRSTYSSGSQRRTSTSSPNYSRNRSNSGSSSRSYNSRSRSSSGSITRSSGSRRSSSSSSSSSSGRR